MQCKSVCATNYGGTKLGVIKMSPKTKTGTTLELVNNESTGPTPIPVNSPLEFKVFKSAMLGVIKDGSSTKAIDACVKTIYTNLQASVKSTQTLALSVWEFATLTNASHDEVAEAMATGLQKTLSKSYISRLFAAGQVIATNQDAALIRDVQKLDILSKLTSKQLNSALKVEGGILFVCDQAECVLNRGRFDMVVRKAFPSQFTDTVKAPVAGVLANRAKAHALKYLETIAENSNSAVTGKAFIASLESDIAALAAVKAQKKTA